MLYLLYKVAILLTFSEWMANLIGASPLCTLQTEN